MSKWIRKGDKIVVIAGNDKGKSGEVISRNEDRVVVQGVNLRKKHVKRQQKTPGGSIIEIEAPLHISNIAMCNAEGSPVKPKVRINKTGDKEIFFLDGEKEVVLRQIRKHS